MKISGNYILSKKYTLENTLNAEKLLCSLWNSSVNLICILNLCKTTWFIIFFFNLVVVTFGIAGAVAWSTKLNTFSQKKTPGDLSLK